MEATRELAGTLPTLGKGEMRRTFQAESSHRPCAVCRDWRRRPQIVCLVRTACGRCSYCRIPLGSCSCVLTSQVLQPPLHVVSSLYLGPCPPSDQGLSFSLRGRSLVQSVAQQGKGHCAPRQGQECSEWVPRSQVPETPLATVAAGAVCSQRALQGWA